MKIKDQKYRALISSDWNECLAPCGPFDPITFNYPSLEPEVRDIFRAYTGNQIALSEAARQMASLVPAEITEDQMDVYLDERFATYRGVPELIEWCSEKNILFMINTTGMRGYFQRVFKKGLLPQVPVVSANPMIKFKEQGKAVCQWYDLFETQDKPANTRKITDAFDIRAEKVILIGDSGGDGPHFEWGARAGAFLVGSMTKWSLEQYCEKRGIQIDLYFGLRYLEGEERKEVAEMGINFTDLIPKIGAVL